MPETKKYGQTTYEAEANFLFPGGCTEGNNSGGDCDWCYVYYDGDCPDCEHNVKLHNDRYGCKADLGDREGDESGPAVARGECGCQRMAKFYRPISSEAHHAQ